MDNLTALENITTIHLESTVDKIIKQLKNLIKSGQLQPGDRLPAERILAEKFGVGRGYIREAILKLEFYGLLKTSPQSGTYVEGFSIKMLDSIITDIVSFNKEDFSSLIESRYYMEINSARLAAERRTETDVEQMKEALSEFDAKIKNGIPAVEEDMLFHIKIAGATRNSVIESLILIIMPDLIKVINLMDIGKACDKYETSAQHHKILQAIVRQDIEAAGDAMAGHLDQTMRNRMTL